jgi:hypothetical protein
VGVNRHARREMEELSVDDEEMCVWLYRRCDDGHLSQGTDMWFWWTVYCDLMDYFEPKPTGGVSA